MTTLADLAATLGATAMTKPAWEVVLEAELLRYHELGEHPQGLGVFTDLRRKILAEEQRRREAQKPGEVQRRPGNDRQRTVAQVILARTTGGFACCNRHADNQSCDCLELAEDYEAQRERDGRLLPLAAWDAKYPNPSGCSICRDPNCTDPGGKH